MSAYNFLFIFVALMLSSFSHTNAAENPAFNRADDSDNLPPFVGDRPARPPGDRTGRRNNQNDAGNGDPPAIPPQNFARGNPAPNLPNTGPVTGDLNVQLAFLIDRAGLTGDPTTGRNLPDISSELPALGKLLFFSSNLGGEKDTACVSCHHPVLGGGDNLSLSVGVHAVDSENEPDPQLLGFGRHPEIAGDLPVVPRNAPTTFNVGLWDRGLFWDSRVANIGRTRRSTRTSSFITTPDSESFNEADTNLPEGISLAATQARFPVTASAEMRGTFAQEDDNQSLRSLLAARFTDTVDGWLNQFELAFGDDEISFDRIADAIGEYERSMVFVESPWKQYVTGNQAALTNEQKAGAILFFTPVNQGGAGCNRCHSGDAFTDGRHHIVGFPQVTDDLGRESVNNNVRDRYHFRTASLLNVSATAPYGHSGLYQTLEEVVRHYDNPRRSVENLFGEVNGEAFLRTETPFCQLPQIQRIIEASGEDCANLFPNAFDNSLLALQQLRNNQARSPLRRTPNLNEQEVNEVVAFLKSLTDPCVEDRECLDPWIIDNDDLGTYPDDSALIAHDEQKLDL